MKSKFEQIVDMANLEIVEYDVHTRKIMKNMNRKLACYVMSYLQSGSAVLEINGEKYELNAGSIILIPKNLLHSHYKTDSEPATFLWWHFNYTLFEKVDILQLLNFPIVSYLSNRNEFERIFYRFSSSGNRRNIISMNLQKKACSLELLAFMIDSLLNGNEIQFSTHIPKEFLQIFYIVNSTNKISLEKLAKQFSLNSTYISNRFKYYFGVSPIDMHNEYLLRYSLNALSNTDISIGELAEKMAYVDISSFTHFFQKRMGISPSEYRKSMRV